MTRPKLREAAAPGGDGTSAPAGAAPFSLAIAGVIVPRGQLVAALQPFLPQLTDIQPFEDGERFLFVFDPAPATDLAPAAQTEP